MFLHFLAPTNEKESYRNVYSNNICPISYMLHKTYIIHNRKNKPRYKCVSLYVSCILLFLEMKKTAIANVTAFNINMVPMSLHTFANARHVLHCNSYRSSAQTQHNILYSHIEPNTYDYNDTNFGKVVLRRCIHFPNRKQRQALRINKRKGKH